LENLDTREEKENYMMVVPYPFTHSKLKVIL